MLTLEVRFFLCWMGAKPCRLCYDPTVRALDTSPEIAAMQARIHASMTGEQRILLALELSFLTRALGKAGLRASHPDWSDEQVTRSFLRSLFDPGPIPPGL